MKKWIIWGVVILVILVGIFSYNGLVGLRADAKTAWADVESSYQRRNDLIGNLVNTVKGAADFERNTLTDVIEARSKATSINVSADELNPEQVQKFQQAQSQLSGALSRLLVTVERYPDLKANQNFLALQSQLEGTENRINVARDRYNEAVNKYDKKKHSFPQVLLAGALGFEDMARFKAEEGAEKAPEVDFNFE